MIFKVFAFLLVSFPQGTKKGVKFTYFAPEAQSVYLVGDFNGWNTSQTPMKKDKEGTWSVIIPLNPGKYQYKFFVDGKYEKDPTNPVTEGPYGNSVVKVGENYSVLPPLMSNNTPMNSYVTFVGNAKGFLVASWDTTNYLKLYNIETDVRMEINANIRDEANLVADFHYNTTRGQDPSTFHIPFYFERAKLSFEKKELRITSFYNTFSYESPDPIKIIGQVNEFGYPFGRGEQGVLIEITTKRIISKITGLYSNEISSGRDIGFLSLTKNFNNNLYTGLGFYASHGNNIEYQVVSPDSERLNDSMYLHFNTYEDRYAYSLEFGEREGLNFQLLVGKDVKRANYYDVDGSKSQQSPINRKWDIEKWYKFRSIYSSEKLTAYIDAEHHNYYDLFLSEFGQGYSTLKTGLSLNSENINIGVAQHFLFAHKNSTKWDALFRKFDIMRLPYIEYPLLGYKQYLTLFADFDYEIFKLINLKLQLKTARYALNQPPRSDEANFIFILPINRAKFYYDLRYYHIKSSYVNIDRDFFDHYLELSYALSKNLRTKIGYGFYPYNLLDEYTQRRDYLSEMGVNITQLKNNFRGLGGIIEKGESEIANKKELRVWLELSF